MLHYRRFHKLCSVATGTFYSSPAIRSAWDKLGKEFSEMNKSDQAKTGIQLLLSQCDGKFTWISAGTSQEPIVHRELAFCDLDAF